MFPSFRARESIKTGLAMTITIGIALRMDFLEPAWAGFAVAMISLDTAGQSLNKAAMRTLGTLVAFLASLTFIGLFPQQRWAMLLALTPYIGVCAYMIAGKKRPYFWFVTAFVCLTVMINGGTDSENAFRFAVARVEETALGILVYSLISIFLWPETSQGQLEAASRKNFDIQQQLFRAYRDLLYGRGAEVDSRSLRPQQAQSLTQLGMVLNAAETDSYQVWALRNAWRRFHALSTQLMEALGRWRICLPEVRELDLARLLPGLGATFEELDRRFERIGGALSGEEPEGEPRDVDLEVARNEATSLSHFQKAALALLLAQLRVLDEASRGLLDCVREIRGSGRIESAPARPAAASRLSFDPDRFRSVVSVVLTMWTAFAVWIWLDPPGHAMFWFMATQWSLVSALSGAPVPALLPGMLFGIVAGGIAYLGVMPHLSGYGELGLMLFVATAGGVYLLWEPRLRVIKAIYLALLLVLTSIDNQQSYGFSGYANTSAAVLLTLALSSAVAYLPGSPRPEKVFLRLVSRFFRHAELLMWQLAPDRGRSQGLLARWRSAWLRNDLLEIPVKLFALVDRIDYRLLPGTDPEHVGDLVRNLLSVATRIQELLEARRHVDPDPRIEQVVADVREWRELAQEQFRRWAADPSAALAPGEDMSARLNRRLARMEASLEAARTRAGEHGFPLDWEALYRYLGGFRGLSEAAIGYAGPASAVDWGPWREARF